jgi:hypothetical protein
VVKVSGVGVWLLPEQEIDGLLGEVGQVAQDPVFLDLEIASNIVELCIDVNAFQLTPVLC